MNINYQNTKIYLIRDLDDRVLPYIGSTTETLKDRLRAHRKKSNSTSSKYIIELANYIIELIEAYPCDTKEEKLKREQYYIDSIKCCNVRKAYTGMTHVEQMHLSYIKNKEKIQERNKEKITCDVCGSIILKSKKSDHNKTKKHNEYLNNLINKE